MAATKIWAIKDSLQRVLDYAANPDKTEYDALAQTLHYAENDAKTKLNESAQLVTGIHCRANHAWEDMRTVQERFGKTDGVVALHAYQSFREGEVTPEQCHEIGVALARKVWGKRFQVLVATHMNTDNLHNHFVILSLATMLLQLHGLLPAVPHLICPPAKNLFVSMQTIHSDNLRSLVHPYD